MEEGTVMLEKDGQKCSSDGKGSKRRRFMRAVKAVLFHIKLRRRDQEKKKIGSDLMMRSNSGLSFRFRKRSHEIESSKSDLTKSASTRSTSSSLSSASVLSSSSSSTPRTSVSSVNQNPKPQKQNNLKEQSSLREQSISLKTEGEKQRRIGSIVIGFLLILMSLGLTVLCGKLCAIAFNAMWLICLPKKWGLSSSMGPEVMNDRVEEPIKEQRRRVIMEGLLDRRHHHQSWQLRKF